MSTSIPFKRESLFLNRVWRSARDILSPANTEKHSLDDHSSRPAKRRRVPEEPLDHEVLASVGPIFSDPSQGVSKALRFQVLGIGHGDAEGTHVNGLSYENGPAVRSISARCKLTIFKYVPRVETRPIYCDSQMCQLKFFRDADGSCRQGHIYLREPFQVAAEKLCINRDDGQGFGLGDAYLVQTELESVGDPNWPPFDLLSLSGQTTHDEPPATTQQRQQWVFSSTLSYDFSKGRLSTLVTLRKAPGLDLPTNLVMDTDLRWSSPAIPQEKAVQVSNASESLAPLHRGLPKGKLKGHVSGRANTIDNEQAHHDDEDGDTADDEEEEAITPTRSLRMRDKPQNYNLKLLSDKARGKELREKKRRNDGKASAAQVTWILPVRNGHVVLDSWSCVRCFATHHSVEGLKEHVKQHKEFNFTTEFSARGGWSIAIAAHEGATPQAGKKITSDEPPSSGADDDQWEDGSSSLKAASHVWPPALAKRTRVPNTRQPLYDSLSKAILKPGTMVDKPPLNNDWLLQKHRDIIKDYTDIPASEKEYISEWDAFSMARRATVAPHLNRIYLEFISEKASWLVTSQSRMIEVCKYLCILNAQDFLEKSTINKALDILREAKAEAQKSLPKSAEESLLTAVSKPTFSRNCCRFCGQLVPPLPNQLICKNMDCKYPFYHSDCAEGKTTMAVGARKWRCDDCCK